jgi:transposase
MARQKDGWIKLFSSVLDKKYSDAEFKVWIGLLLLANPPKSKDVGLVDLSHRELSKLLNVGLGSIERAKARFIKEGQVEEVIIPSKTRPIKALRIINFAKYQGQVYPKQTGGDCTTSDCISGGDCHKNGTEIVPPAIVSLEKIVPPAIVSLGEIVPKTGEIVPKTGEIVPKTGEIVPLESVSHAQAEATQEDKEDKEDKEVGSKGVKGGTKSSLSKKQFGEFSNVLLTEEEFKKLVDKFGEFSTEIKIENLSSALESKGYKYKSHYATIIQWDLQDQKKGTQKALPLLPQNQYSGIWKNDDEE